MIELQEYAIGTHPLITLPFPGTPCLAQFSLDNLWYRAVVTSELYYCNIILFMMVVMVARCRE